MILEIKVGCDFPTCTHTITLTKNHGVFFRGDWKRRHPHFITEHLCPDHKHLSWSEIDKRKIEYGVNKDILEFRDHSRQVSKDRGVYLGED
jgi:hypothetical protein